MSQLPNQYRHTRRGWCPACAHERLRVTLALRLVNLTHAIDMTRGAFVERELLEDLRDAYDPKLDWDECTVRHATLGERAERAGRDLAEQRKREAMGRRAMLRVLDRMGVDW